MRVINRSNTDEIDQIGQLFQTLGNSQIVVLNEFSKMIPTLPKGFIKTLKIILF